MPSVVTTSELFEGDVSKVKMWLTSDDCQTNNEKILNLYCHAMTIDRIDICKVIIDSGQLNNKYVAPAMSAAYTVGLLSLAQLILDVIVIVHGSRALHCVMQVEGVTLS